MGMSPFFKDLRKKIGHSLLQLPSVTVINYDKLGRALFIKHRDTELWVAPGGMIEPGESPADAAVREMWEETGLHVELTGILGVYGGSEFIVEYSNGDKTSYVMTVFESQIIDGSLSLVNDESMEGAYFTKEEIQSKNTQSWMKMILDDVFLNRGKASFKASTWKPSIHNKDEC
jgi:8-oxo-dGTP pyrophosphatase MutT (NUDIX family)